MVVIETGALSELSTEAGASKDTTISTDCSAMGTKEYSGVDDKDSPPPAAFPLIEQGVCAYFEHGHMPRDSTNSTVVIT